jgi:hypothetical protein
MAFWLHYYWSLETRIWEGERLRVSLLHPASMGIMDSWLMTSYYSTSTLSHSYSHSRHQTSSKCLLYLLLPPFPSQYYIYIRLISKRGKGWRWLRPEPRAKIIPPEHCTAQHTPRASALLLAKNPFLYFRRMVMKKWMSSSGNYLSPMCQLFTSTSLVWNYLLFRANKNINMVQIVEAFIIWEPLNFYIVLSWINNCNKLILMSL